MRGHNLQVESHCSRDRKGGKQKVMREPSSVPFLGKNKTDRERLKTMCVHGAVLTPTASSHRTDWGRKEVIPLHPPPTLGPLLALLRYSSAHLALSARPL